MRRITLGQESRSARSPHTEGNARRVQRRDEPPVVAQRCPTTFDPTTKVLDPPKGFLQIRDLDVDPRPDVGSSGAGRSLQPADALSAGR
jgi:hypothetical protein